MTNYLHLYVYVYMYTYTHICPKQSGNYDKMLEDIKQMQLNYRGNGSKNTVAQKLLEASSWELINSKSLSRP